MPIRANGVNICRFIDDSDGHHNKKVPLPSSGPLSSNRQCNKLVYNQVAAVGKPSELRLERPRKMVALYYQYIHTAEKYVSSFVFSVNT